MPPPGASASSATLAPSTPCSARPRPIRIATFATAPPSRRRSYAAISADGNDSILYLEEVRCQSPGSRHAPWDHFDILESYAFAQSRVQARPGADVASLLSDFAVK